MHGDAAKLLFLADGRKYLVVTPVPNLTYGWGVAASLEQYTVMCAFVDRSSQSQIKILLELCKFNGNAVKLLLRAVRRKYLVVTPVPTSPSGGGVAAPGPYPDASQKPLALRTEDTGGVA